VGTLLLALATCGASAAGPKRVLLLDPFGRDVPPSSVALSAFRTALAREFGEPLEFYEMSLDRARFQEPEAEDPFVPFLERQIANRPIDLVVTVGGPGMDFVGRYHERLFQNTPIVFIAGPPGVAQAGSLASKATQVTLPLRLASMVEDILQVQPQTTNIAVVFGASALERATLEQCRREFQQFTNRVGFTWLNDLPLEQILKRCSSLPPRSFILHGLFVVDAAGVPWEKDEALRRLHQVANAPLFGYFASELGLGIIGGRLIQDGEVGAHAARAASRILRGESPGNIPLQMLPEPTPVYDWRELHRWGISEARLPAGSIIQFRQPGFWEQYWWPIVGTLLFCLFQAALIIGLLINWAKRRQGEAEAALIADISSKFVNLPASEVDREIMDAERRICEFLRIDFSALWQWSDEPPGRFLLTHYYSAKEGPQPSKQLSDRDYPWFVQQFRAGRTVAISSLEELPAEAAPDREVCRRHGVKSNLSLPLSVGGKLVGILGLNTTRAERDWPDALVQRLKLVAQVFANALARKGADQALRESKERLSLAADAAQLGVWGWNIASNQVWGSERWLRLFGLASGDQVSFEEVLQRIHPDDRGTVESEVRRTLASRSDYAGEFRVVLPDGTQRWIASRGRGYPDANGTPARMLGAALDITARKNADRMLLESEQRFRLLIEQAPEAVAVMDLERKRLIEVNAQAERLFGCSRQDLLSAGLHRFYTPDQPDGRPIAESIREHDEAALRGETVVFERRLCNVLGQRLDCEVRLVRLPGRERKLLRASFTDITARKHAEEQVRQLSLAVEQSPVSVVITDLQGVIIYVNRKFSELSGYTVPECIGQNPRMLKSGESPLSTYQELWKCITSGGTWKGEFHNRKKNGELYWEWAVISPLLDSNGKITHFVGVKEDITERKRAEAELAQQRAQLTHLSRVTMLGELSGSMAHELNQPLTAILSNAQAAQRFLAEEQPDLAELRDILGDIVAQDKRAGEVIRRLRVLLKKGEVQQHPLRVNDVVLDVLRLVRSELVNQNFTARTDLAPGLPLVRGDGVQLQQVLLNLVMNACEAMVGSQKEARQFTIRTDRSEDGCVRVSVVDGGPGIAPEDLERVFASFYTSKPQGMGLGLAVCRSIITAHNGKLWATNNPGRGAAFHFTLPAIGDEGGVTRAGGSHQ
jgi:PAS domain S-box-containing protein